jgi:hypothetical protein
LQAHPLLLALLLPLLLLVMTMAWQQLVHVRAFIV